MQWIVASYSFTDGRGQCVVRRERVTAEGLFPRSPMLRERNAALLAQLADITVIYDRDDPDRAKLYPFDNFKVAGELT
jgi:hypothetical protein